VADGARAETPRRQDIGAAVKLARETSLIDPVEIVRRHTSALRLIPYPFWGVPAGVHLFIISAC
jgi:hypothetical protein